MEDFQELNLMTSDDVFTRNSSLREIFSSLLNQNWKIVALIEQIANDDDDNVVTGNDMRECRCNHPATRRKSSVHDSDCSASLLQPTK